MSGVIPTSRQIVKLTDEEIVLRLMEVRGVGRWTVEMLLIFQLGRFDVLPVDDFGVRSGFGHAYQKGKMPKPKELLAFGEKWRPHRTTCGVVSLWRAADSDAKVAATPVADPMPGSGAPAAAGQKKGVTRGVSFWLYNFLWTKIPKTVEA